jgi:hypothetical protein
MDAHRPYRAGQPIEDYCRACKADRMHTVMVVDGTGQPLRAVCDFCRSEHNYRGGGRLERTARPGAQSHSTYSPPAPAARSASPVPYEVPDMPSDGSELEQLLRRIIREETGLTPVAPAVKWRGGTLALRPATPGVQEKTWPIETFFHKVVMLRNRLRTLEQQLNASELPDDVKVKLQGYITGCYGSLTSFNVLFADEADQFKGTGGD